MSKWSSTTPWVTGCRAASVDLADNVGNGVPASATGMRRWWMGSSSHRANLLKPGTPPPASSVRAEATGHCWFQVLRRSSACSPLPGHWSNRRLADVHHGQHADQISYYSPTACHPAPRAARAQPAGINQIL